MLLLFGETVMIGFSHSDIDPEFQDMLATHCDSVNRLHKLVDVSDEFKSILLFIVGIMTGNRRRELFLYTFSQLSEMGTGFDSSFEKGNAQSDRRDDVRIGFITCMCGCYIDMRVVGRQVMAWGSQGKVDQIELSNDREQAAKQVDDLFGKWWGE